MPKEKKERRIQSRQWQIIAPAEWDNLEAIREKIKLASQRYYFMLHDRDVDEFAEPKKPHWHFLFTFGSSRDLTTVTNYFKDIENLLPNSYEKINSIYWAKRYLVHADDPQKAQYSHLHVETNDKNYIDLFIPQLGKIEALNREKNVLKNISQYKTFWEFLECYEPQMASLGFSARMNLTIQLRRYYEYYYSIEKAVASYNDGFASIDPPYEHKEKEDFPF